MPRSAMNWGDNLRLIEHGYHHREWESCRSSPPLTWRAVDPAGLDDRQADPGAAALPSSRAELAEERAGNTAGHSLLPGLIA